jgi:hypothetical protein
MTTEKCLAYCSHKNFKYFGLQCGLVIYSETLEFNAYQIKIESNVGKDVAYGWLIWLIS